MASTHDYDADMDVLAAIASRDDDLSDDADSDSSLNGSSEPPTQPLQNAAPPIDLAGIGAPPLSKPAKRSSMFGWMSTPKSSSSATSSSNFMTPSSLASFARTTPTSSSKSSSPRSPTKATPKARSPRAARSGGGFFGGSRSGPDAKEMAGPVAQLTEAGKVCLKDHALFDETLKRRQTQVVSAVKEVKATRKAAVSQETDKLDKSIATAESIKKKLVTSLKALVKAGDTTAFDQMEAIALGLDEIEEDDEDEGEIVVDAGAAATDEDFVQAASNPIATPERRADAFENHDTTSSSKELADLEAAITAMRSVVPLKGMPVPAVGNPLDQLRFFDWSSRVLKAQHAALNLDYYFPKAEGWKLRIFIPEENMYMGAKDIGVERLKCNMALSLGKEGLQVTLSDIDFMCTVYQMRFKGSSSTARALKQLLSPELVRLGIGGSVNIHAHFAKKRWRNKRCVFDLKVVKSITGALTAPDSLVRRLINTILPPLVRHAVIKSLPLELGPFLEQGGSNLRIAFEVSVEESIPRDVWTAPLLQSEEARTLLGVDQRQAAVLSLLLSEGTAVGRTSGLSGAPSIDALYVYQLRYQDGGKAWEDLCSAWDHRFVSVCPESTPKGWFPSLLGRITELGRRPLNVEVIVKDLAVAVDVQDTIQLWSQIFLRVVLATIKRAKDLKQPHINFKSPEKVSAEAHALMALVQSAAVVACNSMQRAGLMIDLEMLGGSTLRAMASITDLEVNSKLPEKLVIAVPYSVLVVPPLLITSEVDQDTGGLMVEVIWRGPLPPRRTIEGTVADERKDKQTCYKLLEDFGVESFSEALTMAAGGGSIGHLQRLGREGAIACGVPKIKAGKLFKAIEAASPQSTLEDSTLLAATALIGSFGMGLKGGRVLLTSDEISARVGINSKMLDHLLIAEKSPEAAAAAAAKSPTETSSKEELDEAVLEYVAPMLFDDVHDLKVLFTKLQVTAAPPPEGKDSDIVLSVNMVEGLGKVNIKLDIAKILTDALDLVELQNMQWGQGVY